MANLVFRRGNQPEARRGVDAFQLMDSLLRWDPYGTAQSAARPGTFQPAFQVHETKDGYVFKADLPGLKESDVEVSLHGSQLTISGQREEAADKDVRGYHVYERSFGSFARTFQLPEGTDFEGIRADMKDGVLTLFAPKKPEVQPRKISLQPAQDPKTIA